jgi:hypothetical protein
MKRLYTKEIFIFILVVIILLMGWYGSKRPHTVASTPVDVVSLRQHIIDSLEYYELIRLDSLSEEASRYIKVYERRAKDAKANYNRQKQISDSLMDLYGAKLDTICREVVQSKQNEIDTLTSVVNALDNEAQEYSNKLYLVENILVSTNTSLTGQKKVNENLAKINEQLQKDVKRTWLERNAIWIGAITGSLTTILIVK